MSDATKEKIRAALIRTHCVKGHPFTEENVYRHPSGERRCRECGRARQREYERAKARRRRGMANDCSTCYEGLPQSECPKSERECGHHCNHSWNQEHCCWCGKTFYEQQ